MHEYTYGSHLSKAASQPPLVQTLDVQWSHLSSGPVYVCTYKAATCPKQTAVHCIASLLCNVAPLPKAAMSGGLTGGRTGQVSLHTIHAIAILCSIQVHTGLSGAAHV